MKQRKKRLPIWIEEIMKKRMSISSYRIYQTSFSLYQYSLNKNKALLGIVILIACMLTMLTGLIVNVEANWNKSQIRLLGSDAKLVVQTSEEELLENLYSQRQIKAVGLVYQVCTLEEFSVCYADEVCWNSIFLPAIGNVKGNYPQKKNEIMVSRRFLSENGYEDCEPGDEIQIKNMGDFQVSGIFTDYSRAVGVQNLYVSKEYAKAENILRDDNRKVMLASGLEQYYLKKIVESECNIPSKNISFLKYQSVDRDRTVVLLKGILFFLFVCGGIAVYHVFYTVVSADQKFYGLFSVIGMSRYHISDCMKWQSGFVAVPGIFAGVSLGLLGQIAVVPWFMNQFLGANRKVREYLVTEVELYPAIPLIAAILIAGMVLAGFCMVAHRISKLSPMECLKNTGLTKKAKSVRKKTIQKKQSRKEKIRTSRKSIWNLAYQHQKALAGSNLLTGLSLFISNQFFLVVWAMSQYYKGAGSLNVDLLQRAGSMAILGNFIGIVVFGTEIIRLYSVMYIKLQTRKKQFYLLRQIGMTRKQLKTMITLEGILQFGYSLLVAVILEGPIWIGITFFMNENGVEIAGFPLGLWLVILMIDFVVFVSSARICFAEGISKNAGMQGR